MADLRTDLRVRVCRPDEQLGSGASYEERRKAFWAPILEALRRMPRETPIDEAFFENALRRELPWRLRSRFLELFAGAAFKKALSSSPSDERRWIERLRSGRREPAWAATQIIFSVTSIDYASMELGIGLEPLSKAIELFDKNFDWFRAAIEGFVPKTIVETITYAQEFGNSEIGALIGRLQQSISYEPGLVAAFAARSMPGAENHEMTSADKARWAWIAANTSLVVPTVLAAVYLYFAHQDVRDRENDRADEYRRIIDQHTKLLSTCGALLSQSAERSKTTAPSAKPGQP